MQFTHTAKQLARELSPAFSLVKNSKGVVPVLNYLQIANGAVTASDGYTSIRIMGIGEGGKMLVPADKFEQLLKVAGDAEVSVDAVAGAVEIRAGRGKYKLQTIPADDYPPVAAIEGLTKYDVDGLADAVRRVVWALPDKDHRRVLLCVNLRNDGGRWRVTATDGKKLATMQLGETTAELNINLPPSVLGLVTDSVLASDTRVEFVDKDKYVQSSLYNGKFPEIGAVIPKQYNHKITVDAKALAKALKAASVTSKDKVMSVVLRAEEERLLLTSTEVDVGSSEVVVDCALDGEPIEFALNWKIASEWLGQFDGEVVLCLAGLNTPIVIERDNYLTLVMPIKLADATAAEVETND